MIIIEILEKALFVESSSKDCIFNTKGKMYSFINPYGYHLVRKNKDLFEKLDGLFVDGILFCLFSRWFYRFKITRRSFDLTTVAAGLFDFIVKNNKSIYFVGAKQAEIERSILQYKLAYPKMNIVGFRNGYFVNDKEYITEIRKIVQINPDYVVVGMGAIKQEEFLIALKNNEYKGIGFTCGGFIHQSVNGIYYYPEWINRYNLRAFYRLYKEKETRKRLYSVFFQFPVLFIRDFVSYKFSNKIRNIDFIFKFSR